MSLSPLFNILLMEEAQKNAHIPNNEDVVIMEAMSLGVVVSQTSTQPGSPVIGEMYFISGAGSGVDWTGHTDEFAIFTFGGWRFVPATEGYVFYDKNQSLLFIWDGAAAVDPSTISGIPISIGAESGLRLTRGVIAENGAILEGAGFTVAKGATGFYTITFSPAFSAVPAIGHAVDNDTSGGTFRTTLLTIEGPPSASSLPVVIIESFSGIGRNAEFHFIAIGPK